MSPPVYRWEWATNPDLQETSICSAMTNGRNSPGEGEWIQLQGCRQECCCGKCTSSTHAKRHSSTQGLLRISQKACKPCPTSTMGCPAGQMSVSKNSLHPPTTNVCGTSTGLGSFVPNLDFSDCCNGPDICYGKHSVLHLVHHSGRE